MNTEETNEPVLEPIELKKLTPDELTELATGIATRQVFTSNDVPEEDARMIGSIWMPLGLGCFVGKDIAGIGFIYSWIRDAGPRSINGYPCFFSFKIFPGDQLQALRDEYNNVLEKMKVT